MSRKTVEKNNNIHKIKENIENTQNNVELANKMIATISDHTTKKSLEDKNERRLENIDSMVSEVKSEVPGD